MPVALKRSVSFWLLAAAVGMFLLQWFPPTDFLLWFATFIFLGPLFINAMLVHAFLVALFAESAIGRLPRVLMIAPVLAYGAYYWAYFEQARIVAEETAKLKDINVGKVLDFDPSTMSLVFDNGFPQGTLEVFVARHQIPVAYSRVISARLVPAPQCASINSFKNGALAWKQDTKHLYPYKLLTQETEPCLLTRREQPTQRPVYAREVDHASTQQKWLGISEPSTDIVFDGKVLGSLQSVIVHHMSPYLQALGCGLVDGPAAAWVCISGLFEGGYQRIDPDPPSVDKTRFDTPPSILLGLPKYTDADILNFVGYSSNASIVVLAQSPPSN